VQTHDEPDYHGIDAFEGQLASHSLEKSESTKLHMPKQTSKYLNQKMHCMLTLCHCHGFVGLTSCCKPTLVASSILDDRHIIEHGTGRSCPDSAVPALGAPPSWRASDFVRQSMAWRMAA
jgi:hypothetical protein